MLLQDENSRKKRRKEPKRWNTAKKMHEKKPVEILQSCGCLRSILREGMPNTQFEAINIHSTMLICLPPKPSAKSPTLLNMYMNSMSMSHTFVSVCTCVCVACESEERLEFHVWNDVT